MIRSGQFSPWPVAAGRRFLASDGRELGAGRAGGAAKAGFNRITSATPTPFFALGTPRQHPDRPVGKNPTPQTGGCPLHLEAA